MAFVVLNARIRQATYFVAGQSETEVEISIFSSRELRVISTDGL